MTDGQFVKRIVVGIVAVLVVVIGSLTSTSCVSAGHRGVLTTMGKVEGKVLGEGFHFKAPWQSVVEVEIRTRKIEAKTQAASKDLQAVASVVALNAHPDPGAVADLYAKVGLEYEQRIIVPAISEALKQSTAMFSAEELITKREEAKMTTVDALKKRLTPLGIVVEDFSITDLNFSRSFNEAIEAKVTAKEQKLKAQNDLERIEIEAKQAKARAEGQKQAAIAKAEGDAESVRIVSEQLKVSPEYVAWLKVKRWNGKLPHVTGGAVPMIEVGK